jgi:hypothetical protein
LRIGYPGVTANRCQTRFVLRKLTMVRCIAELTIELMVAVIFSTRVLAVHTGRRVLSDILLSRMTRERLKRMEGGLCR